MLYNITLTSNEIDLVFDLKVIDLIEAMRPFWEESSSAPYPGDPYVHNGFRKIYSDHHPIEFRIKIGTADDD